MKAVALFFLGMNLFHSGFAQDSVRHRIIFIGDAGEIDKEQQAVIPAASKLIIPDKTTVVFLGDNIYPRGMGLPGSPEEKETQFILQSQYKPMREKGAPVYFLPGNHDWDRMGKNGLAKIKHEWSWLEEQSDSLLKLVPPDGCPGPVEINISNEVTIIAFDSEWWLFPYNKTNPDANCNCKTKQDVTNQMQELFYKNRKKIIFLASHHPFQSYGTHGGYFGWKDNIFPLTAASDNLYIPLPIIGSLYPLLRKAFNSPEDLRHPLYKNMIRQVDAVFSGFPNLIHVAGHEHGLQFIRDSQIQIISGAGAKQTFAKKGKSSLFATATQGFVTADMLENRTVLFTYYEYKESVLVPVFTYIQVFPKLYFPEDPEFPVDLRDSALRAVHPGYDKPGNFHRKLFGENYRKEWAAPTMLPLIRLSTFQGGLKPLQRGGGMQSNSLRLEDSAGKEWVIRSVEKNVDLLLPEALRSTFARDFLDDVTSGQHPFSALVVPPLANAANIPHANPVIGIIAPDKNLGFYEKSFANTICLIEEREPLGKSDNTPRMMANLLSDNDNHIKGKEFLRARMFDMYLGDWDRHEDQWRWHNVKSGKEKLYVAVPRDRDQVFHLTQGLLPKLASKPYLLPTLQNFGGKIERPKFSLIKTGFLNAFPDMQFEYTIWMNSAIKFKNELTDSVIEEGLRRLPATSYSLRHDVLYKQLKDRRDDIPRAMDEYYRFVNKIVDIRLSDKNESVHIEDDTSGSMKITVLKINKEGDVRQELMKKTYDARITKEIRIYTSAGNDSVVINNSHSPIALRIIGGEGKKTYEVTKSINKINLYDKPGNHIFYGDSSRFRSHFSTDTFNTRFVPVNLYGYTMPLVNVGINPDDGFLVGLGFLHTGQGSFRKTPYGHEIQMMVTHSFTTSAFSVSFHGEWIKAVANADLTIQANVFAPDNTQNFFGTGNETTISKAKGYKEYYRTRFNIYELKPMLRWGDKTRASLSIGPGLQIYSLHTNDNQGRFILQPGAVSTYDSNSISEAKAHAGLLVTLIQDLRNNKLLPTWGSYVKLQLNGWQALNTVTKSYGQAIGEVALYKSLNRRSTIVLADRVGGTYTFGDPAFYQTAYLGGQGNLLGYSKFRYSGMNSLYNNLELRLKLADFVNYILPGQLGLFGFYDLGRVWVKDDPSHVWHNGVGGGLYFSPAQMAVVQFVVGYSPEGWYPFLNIGFRF